MAASPTKRRRRPPKARRSGSTPTTTAAKTPPANLPPNYRSIDTLTPEQAGMVMDANGWSSESVDVLAQGIAILRQESGFNRKAVNPSSGALGPWQFLGPHPGLSGPCRADPKTNPTCFTDWACSTRCAHDLYKSSGGWGDWASSPTPTDADSEAALAARGAHGTDAFGAVTGAAGDVANVVTSPIAAIADAVKSLIAFIARLFEPSFWLRVGKVVLGAVALIIGTGILARAMLGVDLGLGEHTARAVRYARAAPDPGPGPTPSERRQGRRTLDRVLEDNPDVAKSQRPLDDPPF